MNAESFDETHIPTSGEIQNRRIQELAEWGVDLSLVQSNLARTPTERITHMLELLQLAIALRQGYLRATQQNMTQEEMSS